VTSKGALDVIAQAKKLERKVSCEVTPNHLLLTSDDAARIGSMAIMAPPLRDKTHREALLKNLENGASTPLAQTMRRTLWKRKVQAASGM